MRHLEGDWRVERLSGVLPPMLGVQKRTRGYCGETRLGSFPSMPFRLEQHEGHVALFYRPPFSALVDELRAEADGSWLGRSTLGGCELGRFRMTRSGYHYDPRPKEEGYVARDKLQEKLIDYLRDAHAMEQNVLLMLEPRISTTRDIEIVEMLEHHKTESRRQELVRAAHWLASRNGLDAELADVEAGRSVPAGEMVEKLLALARPALEEGGDWEEVSPLVSETLERGNGAQRQRRAYERAGRLEDAVDMLIEETAQGF